MYPRLARADKTVPGMGRAIRRLARFVSRKWPQPIYELRRELGLPQGQESALRRQALAAPGAGAVFAGAGRGAEGLAGARADYGLLLLRRGGGQRSAAAASGEVFGCGRAAGGVYAGVGGGADGGAVLRVLGAGGDETWRARGAADWHRPAQPAPASAAGVDLRGRVRALLQAVSARGAGGAPGRGGDDGAMFAGGQADADYALLARPARQRDGGCGG